ncbi:glycosyltransferase [Candidatus Woesearchaeota archaeon]|nr:glycosyltransferase [Candidatus Woesearchaeota archaeon]
MGIKEQLGTEKVDIIVGIPSYNEENNIGFVTEQVVAGLKKYFSSYSCIIINLDNDSTDNTRQAFLGTFTDGIPAFYLSTPTGVRGKGNNLRNFFEIAKELKPKACITVDSDLKNITPEWIKNLCQPLLEEYDYVTPIYARHKYDGTITNNIVYPLLVGLFGYNIRQPIGGEFGFSSRLAEHWLSQEWSENVRNYGIDVFMTVNAIIGGYNICSTYLGAKIHKVKDPGESLGPMFRQVIGTLFTLIRAHHKALDGKKIKEVKVFGNTHLEEPPLMCINTNTLLKAFNAGRAKHKELLKQSLSKESYAALKEIALETTSMKAEMWAKMLYELLAAYEKSNRKEELLEAIQPLYFGRVYSFAKQTAGMSQQEAEQEVQRQARAFHELREYCLELLKQEK